MACFESDALDPSLSEGSPSDFHDLGAHGLTSSQISDHQVELSGRRKAPLDPSNSSIPDAVLSGIDRVMDVKTGSTPTSDALGVWRCQALESMPAELFEAPGLADHGGSAIVAGEDLEDDRAAHRSHSPEDTLLIFDYDDTILPSSWIAGQQLKLDESSTLTNVHREELQEVSRCVSETLRVAKRAGKVVLVTNAERGWIELSSHKFLPEIVPLIEGCKLISARTAHESPELRNPLDWKLQAFAREIRTSISNQDGEAEEVAAFTNVVSLGDGAHEREAVLRITASLPACAGKSLRFIERPSILELCRQHRLVSQRLEQLVQHDGSLDLCMRRKSGKNGKKRKRKADAAFGEVNVGRLRQKPKLESVQGFDAVGPTAKVIGA